MTKNEKVIYCDFCGESQHKVAHLVQGPKDIAICDKCVDLCVEIIPKKEPKEPS